MPPKVEERLIWFNGAIMPVYEAKINVLAPTAQFGLNVFEGVRCYWNSAQKELFAFRLADHLKRLKRSQRLLKMEEKFSLKELEEAFIETVKANEYQEDLAVRQTLFVEGFGSWSSRGPLGMFIAPIPKAKTNPEYNKKGLNCCISSWQRINDNALSPRIKCGANYINSRMGQLEALENGYDTTIFLNNHGHISEGPGSCLFMVKNGQLITPLLTDSVLESITRDSIITLAHDLDIPVAERTIDRTEIYNAEEAFLCGSAMEITPIFSVDHYAIGAEAGPITHRLHETYLMAACGQIAKYNHWLTAIYA